jgi:hypothetical protein
MPMDECRPPEDGERGASGVHPRGIGLFTGAFFLVVVLLATRPCPCLPAPRHRPSTEGRLVDGTGALARCVRLSSRSNNANEMNHHVEVEVFGRL